MVLLLIADVFFMLIAMGATIFSSYALAVTLEPLYAPIYVVLLVFNGRQVARQLFAIIGALLERRRDAQLTWAMRWWARSRGLRVGGSFKVREIVPTKLVLVRR
jgi:hypothetical protein